MPKNRSQGKYAPAQLLLPGCRTQDVVARATTRICDCARGINTSGFIFCEDAPWRCPRGVPPASNTGVHHATSERGSVFAKRSKTGRQ